MMYSVTHAVKSGGQHTDTDTDLRRVFARSILVIIDWRESTNVDVYMPDMQARTRRLGNIACATL